MVFESIDKAGYINSDALKRALAYIASLNPDTPEGEYEIEGREMFARVARYRTISRHRGRMEAHRKYADVQALLRGTEVIEWTSLSDMPEADYDSGADVSFYPAPEAPGASVVLKPGVFTLFMPHDAHMPMLAVDGAVDEVTKVVVKIDVDLLRP